MKHTPCLPLTLILLLPISLCAQNFSGSDDFSSNSGLWTVPSGSSVAGGALTVNSGHLNFTSPSLTATTTAEAAYAWAANYGSYAAPWQAQIDFNINITPVSGQTAMWELIVGSSTTPANNFTIGLQWSLAQLMSTGTPLITAYTRLNGSIAESTPPSVNAAGSTASVRISYDPTTTTLTAAYDGNGSTGGYAFTAFHSVDISDSLTNWNMVSGNTFSLLLHATNTVTGSSPMPVYEGAFYADNFIASPTSAVPEPATVGLLAGLVALGFCVWQRRRGA